MLSMSSQSVSASATYEDLPTVLHATHVGRIANQFALAPPREYAEGRQTTTRQVW